MKRREPNYRGLVALAVGTIVALGWATSLVWLSGPNTQPFDETSVALLSTIGGVLAGGVSAYLGGRDRSESGRHEDTEGKQEE